MMQVRLARRDQGIYPIMFDTSVQLMPRVLMNINVVRLERIISITLSTSFSPRWPAHGYLFNFFGKDGFDLNEFIDVGADEFAF